MTLRRADQLKLAITVFDFRLSVRVEPYGKTHLLAVSSSGFTKRELEFLMSLAGDYAAYTCQNPENPEQHEFRIY